MRLHRLPIAVAPAQQETVASYLARLTSLHGLPLRELWEPISVPRPRSRRRDVLAEPDPSMPVIAALRRSVMTPSPRSSWPGPGREVLFTLPPVFATRRLTNS